MKMLLQPKEKPLLTPKHEKDRLKWARKHRNWTQRQWNSVIWSDESRFEVCVGDSRKVIRNKDEAFHRDCIARKVKFPASVMIWGCMSAKGVGNLHFIDGIVNSDKYIRILRTSLLPSIEKLRTNEGEYIFQQDGASCHTSKKTMNWLKNRNIPLLDWTASSPDMSPIEAIWGIMKKKLRQNPARTVPELKTRLQQI